MSDPDGPEYISVAEAEEEAARAEARAEAARARLMRLRSGVTETVDVEDDDGAVEQPAARPSRLRLPRLRRPGRKAVAIGAAAILGCGSLGASGYMVWQHYTIMHKRQLVSEFAASARQGITALMSIDANHAKQDVQRIIDACTGTLKTQVEASSALMAEKAEESKVVGKVTVEAVAVESVSDNSGVVLVSAKSTVTAPDNANRPPALWRLSVNLDRDNGQLKMSKVDFLQ